MGPKPAEAGTIGSTCKELEAPVPAGYSGSTGHVLVLVPLFWRTESLGGGTCLQPVILARGVNGGLLDPKPGGAETLLFSYLA